MRFMISSLRESLVRTDPLQLLLAPLQRNLRPRMMFVSKENNDGAANQRKKALSS
jgi:hypothetical protein